MKLRVSKPFSLPNPPSIKVLITKWIFLILQIKSSWINLILKFLLHIHSFCFLQTINKKLMFYDKKSLLSTGRERGGQILRLGKKKSFTNFLNLSVSKSFVFIMDGGGQELFIFIPLFLLLSNFKQLKSHT